jgi:hypothetical protein
MARTVRRLGLSEMTQGDGEAYERASRGPRRPHSQRPLGMRRWLQLSNVACVAFPDDVAKLIRPVLNAALSMVRTTSPI